MYFLNFTIIYIIILNIAGTCFGMKFYCSSISINSPCYLLMSSKEGYWKKYFLSKLNFVDRHWVRDTLEMAKKNHRLLSVINQYLKLVINENFVKKFLKKFGWKQHYRITYVSLYFESKPNVRFYNSKNSEPSIALHYRKGPHGI
uniref:Uncharacterized protein n=1 Tax=Strongyloides venezuelensis TaxID=75913 RepID=A0A0K0FR16_STRVS